MKCRTGGGRCCGNDLLEIRTAQLIEIDVRIDAGQLLLEIRRQLRQKLSVQTIGHLDVCQRVAIQLQILDLTDAATDAELVLMVLMVIVADGQLRLRLLRAANGLQLSDRAGRLDRLHIVLLYEIRLR